MSYNLNDNKLTSESFSRMIAQPSPIKETSDTRDSINNVIGSQQSKNAIYDYCALNCVNQGNDLLGCYLADFALAGALETIRPCLQPPAQNTPLSKITTFNTITTAANEPFLQSC